MKKVVLITGASRGLGNILANDLSSHGYQVYGGVRTAYEKNEDLFSPITLDLTHEEDLQKAVDTIINKDGRIDVVIHNAGLLYAGAPDTFTLEELRHLFEVNVLGSFRLTQLVLPLMRKQKNGYIIFMSSIRGVESHVYRGLYSATKAAIEAIAFDWAISLSPWNIKVSLIEPGPLSTNPSVIKGSYFDEQSNPYPQIQDFKLAWQLPGEIAPLVRQILDSTNPNFRYQTNAYTEDLIGSHLRDTTGQRWLNEQKKWFSESIQ
jgi:NAD(P)-dependent dehydrogenase (short-subunit alcohol dehydrogenase family)